VELEASKYFSLGASRWARQRILALNGWTAYSPSWDIDRNDEGGERVENGPPFLEGATLGGFYRLRGYRDARFHDKASIYAAAEYRYTLDYNPIRNIEWLRFMKLDWFQLVGFVEGGRVAPDYKPDTLFSDWKSDFGIGLRAMTAGIVVRFDLAHSDEGTNAWVMVGHPF
jgi:outer membrane protein assembly factor BamA